ncbi:MAG: hypothetical protein WBQ94_25155 [Terracidiphilus sp.]
MKLDPDDKDAIRRTAVVQAKTRLSVVSRLLGGSSPTSRLSTAPQNTAVPVSPLNRVDSILMLSFATAAGTFVWNLARRLPMGLRGEGSENFWFEADVMRVFYNISARKSLQTRSQVHPIFALIGYSCDAVIRKVAHLNLNDSVDVFLALTAGLWVIFMYLVIRKLGFDCVMAAGAAALGILSSAGLLFFTIPETYALASVSILATIALILYTQGGRWESAGRVLASATSLSIVVTNWALGLLLTFRKSPWRQWLQLSINGFFLVAVLWSVEKLLMPSAEFFTDFGREKNYLNHLSFVGVLKTANVFIVSSVIAPIEKMTPDFGIHDPVGPAWKLGITFQNSWPGSASMWGVAAVIFWLVLLALGVRSLLIKKRSHFSLSLLIFLVLQLALHILYGAETFMYALDWVPILVIIAVFGLQELGKARWPALAVFILLIAVNNLIEFQRIAGIAQTYQKTYPIHPPSAEEDMAAHFYWGASPTH